jgi:hypothetical protein
MSVNLLNVIDKDTKSQIRDLEHRSPLIIISSVISPANLSSMIGGIMTAVSSLLFGGVAFAEDRFLCFVRCYKE